MAIYVSIQQYNGGLLPEIVPLTLLCDYVEQPFYYHVEFFLSLQQMFPPKPFDCSGDLAAFRFF